jgi:hypothetical protein
MMMTNRTVAIMSFSAMILTRSSAVANTITAASCDVDDVAAAIDVAATGDTVVVPNGTCSWSSGVSISGIHLRGESAGGVTIIHDFPDGYLVTMFEDPSTNTELSRFSFASGAAGASYTVVVYDGGRPALIHDNQWSGVISGIHIASLHGVVWSNTMDTGTISMAAADVQFVAQKIEYLEDYGWLQASTEGTLDPDGEQNLYIEDNTITHVGEGTLDPDDNARMVVRHNTFDNSAMASHGADTSWVGVRHVEVYDNEFIFTNFGDCDGSQTMNLPWFIFIRGGTWVITNNVMPDLSSCSYGDKPGILATVMNLQRDDGLYGCWGAGENTDQTYPAPHQFGQGADGSEQILDPTYIWNNVGSDSGSGNGRFSTTDFGSDECPAPVQSVVDYIHVGRDVILDQPKANWAPYPYPHPLRASHP